MINWKEKVGSRYGWRARIGHISPGIWTNCQEWDRILPDGVVTIITCLGVHKLVKEDFDDAWNSVDIAAKEIATFGVNVILLGGSPVMSYKGYGADEIAIKRITGLTGIPSAASITAVVKALNTLGVKKLAIATPYRDERNRERVKFLGDSGFEVKSIKGLQIERRVVISKLTPDSGYNIARESFLSAKDADAIYLSCSLWPIVQIIDKLEKDFKVPVVTNVQAQIWWALRTLNINEPISGYGRLLESY